MVSIPKELDIVSSLINNISSDYGRNEVGDYIVVFCGKIKWLDKLIYSKSEAITRGLKNGKIYPFVVQAEKTLINLQNMNEYLAKRLFRLSLRVCKKDGGYAFVSGAPDNKRIFGMSIYTEYHFPIMFIENRILLVLHMRN
jgi:hypothetical protein